MSKIDINDAQHPSRQKAIKILETIADKLGDEKMFDGELWYELEDIITNIINNSNKQAKRSVKLK